MNEQISVYKRHRFPEVVISRAVWLYYRFSLNFQEVEELLAARGVVVSYETIRQWCLKFPSSYAKKLRKSLISPPANGNERCDGLNQPDKHSSFSPSMAY